MIMAGVVLLANMSMTFNDELPYIAVFTVASLFLLIQMHAFDERATWIRRRIGDPSTISSLYLRGGTVFIVAAMFGSLRAHRPGRLEPAGRRLGRRARPADRVRGDDRAVSAGRAATRAGPGVTFGSSAIIAGKWFSDDNIAFTAQLPATEKRKDLYWRAVTFNTFDLKGWDQTGMRQGPGRAPGARSSRTRRMRPSATLTRPVNVVRPSGRLPGQRAALGRRAGIAWISRRRSRSPAATAGSPAPTCRWARAPTPSTRACCARTTRTSSAATG